MANYSYLPSTLMNETTPNSYMSEKQGTKQNKKTAIHIGDASRSIPIPHRIHRTPSEVQLLEDEAMADYRDYCMYHRIVSGIAKNNLILGNSHVVSPQREGNNTAISNNIVRARHGNFAQTSTKKESKSTKTHYIPSFESFGGHSLDHLDSMVEDFDIPGIPDSVIDELTDDGIFDIDM